VKRLLALAGLAAMVVGLSACGNSTGGQPTPATTSATQGRSTGTPTSSGGGNTWPVDHACSLLSASDLAALGASGQPTEDMVGTAHACEFASTDFSMGLAIRTNGGLGAFQSNGETLHNSTIGKHQAEQYANSTTCYIAIGVSDSSRVDVSVTQILTGDPCPPAMTLANLIEAKLP